MSPGINNSAESQRCAKAAASLRQRCRAQDIPVVSWRWVRHVLNTPSCHCLGHGTYGDAFLVRHPDVPSKRLVVKDFRGKHKVMTREVEALLRVQDIPGVQRLAGVCLDTKEIISEYAGNTLLQEMQLGDLSSMGDKLWVAWQVLAVVDRLHKKGLCHNDLQPSNICVRRTPSGLRPWSGLHSVTIIDFGFAKNTRSAVLQRAVRHRDERFPWLSPEVADRGPCSPASDVYSLGYVMFWLFDAPNTPYKVRRWAALAMSHRAEERPSLQEGLNIIKSFLSPYYPTPCVAVMDTREDDFSLKQQCEHPTSVRQGQRGV